MFDAIVVSPGFINKGSECEISWAEFQDMTV